MIEVSHFLNRVHSKEDHSGNSGREDKHQQNEQHDQDDNHEHNQDEINAAITSFHGDNQASANGLTAKTVGNGLGLRVILKDGTGTIVRQLTGEEFLKLREVASKDFKTRGKILDQKL